MIGGAADGLRFTRRVLGAAPLKLWNNLEEPPMPSQFPSILRSAAGLTALLVPGLLLGGCASYYPAPPPPAGWAGENWARHVARCERHYPRYDPRTDLIYRPGGTFSCPL
jgi:hypothetical protein